MNKAKLFAGMAFASPITVVCFLFYILPCITMKWYKSLGWMDYAWVFVVNEEKSPKFINNYWKKWAGHAMGNLVVMKKYDPVLNQTTLTHELEHCKQCMRLGVFQPILYALFYLAIKFGCKNSDPYYSNCFEIDARRAAGQVIDVEGFVKKLVKDRDGA